MKKKIRTLMSLALLLAFCFVFTAQAQVIAKADLANEEVVRTPEVRTAENPVAFLSSRTTLSDTWVKEIDRQYAAWLKRTDDTGRGQALQEIIIIAKQHGDKVTFSKLVSPLLNVYIFDKNKNHRLMALSALHAIGDPYGMERLRELVNDDSSEQVRRLTHYALADYYGPKN